MQYAEETHSPALAEDGAGFDLDLDTGVVERRLLDGASELAVLSGVERVKAGENHGFGRRNF